MFNKKSEKLFMTLISRPVKAETVYYMYVLVRVQSSQVLRNCRSAIFGIVCLSVTIEHRFGNLIDQPQRA